MADQPDRLKPLHEAHAIQEVRMAIELASPVTSKVIGEALKLYRSNKWLSDFLPGYREPPTFKIGISEGAESELPVTQKGPGEPSSAIFDRVLPNGTPEWRMMAAKNVVVVTCTQYTRWGEVWGNARRMIRAIMPAYDDVKAEISVFGLQFIDKFIWEGEPNAFRPEHLFKRDSDLLPRAVFSWDETWHTHLGDFQSHDQPSPHRRLTNTNIDIQDETSPDEKTTRVAVIRTLFRNLLSQPLAVGMNICTDDNSGQCDQHMAAMHGACKSILDKLLLQNVTKRISLWAEDPTNAN